MEILLIGCGKMGGALYDGWLEKDPSISVTIIDPYYKGAARAFAHVSELEANYSPSFVVLAVKPQSIAEIAGELPRFKNAIFISIIAGKSLAFFHKYIPESLIIRTMPNLPASIGQGVTAAFANWPLSDSYKRQVSELLEPAGKLIWVEKEELLDAVTAVSGSGPAYVFLFAESLVQAAIALGLETGAAKMLVMETLKGSIALAQGSSDDLRQLKINVTSKGGTTEAALNVLEKNDALNRLIKTAVNQAHLRAKELAE